jgi:hypothetical protein
MTRKHGPSNRQFGIGPLDHLQPDGSNGPDEFPGTSGENRFSDAIDEVSDVQALIQEHYDAEHGADGTPYIILTGSDTDISGSGGAIGFNNINRNVGGEFVPLSGPPYYDFPAPGSGLYLLTWAIDIGAGTFTVNSYANDASLSSVACVGSGVGSTVTYFNSGVNLRLFAGAGPGPLTGAAVAFTIVKLA